MKFEKGNVDFLFVTVVLIKIIKNVGFPLWLWIRITFIASIKLLNLISDFVLCRKIVAVHSAMNKITGFMLFVLPLTTRNKRETVIADGNKYFHLIYLDSENIRNNILQIKKERVDEQGLECWYPLMLEYLKNSPYGRMTFEHSLVYR